MVKLEIEFISGLCPAVLGDGKSGFHYRAQLLMSHLRTRLSRTSGLVFSAGSMFRAAGCGGGADQI